jgi:hypothetical protein
MDMSQLSMRLALQLTAWLFLSSFYATNVWAIALSKATDLIQSNKADLDRFADVKTGEDEALRLIKQIRLAAPTKDEATILARVANSKDYSDVRRRRAVLQLFDRHAQPGMNLGELAALLAGPSWLQRNHVGIVQNLRGYIGIDTIGGETIFYLSIKLPSKDTSSIDLRIRDRLISEDLLFDTLQGKKTSALDLKVTAIDVSADTADDKTLVSERAREWPWSRRGPKYKEIVFLKGDTDYYARQLDFFGIELGVLSPGNKIIYAYHLSNPKPDTRINTNPRSEKRYYFSHQDDFSQADGELLRRAGIKDEVHLVLRFLPRSVESQLTDLENSYPEADPKKRLIRTRFGVQTTKKGFSLYVLEQIQE